jgi:hypothetical protein
MDELFDLGHIVTNVPIARLSGEGSPDEGFLDLDGALAGGVEYYIMAVLRYEVSPLDDPSVCRPRSISLRFVHLADSRVLDEVHYTGNPQVSPAETLRQARDAARALLSHLPADFAG